ncbi:MAG: flagellar assembly peptidoglycan hydrolase FlgJ [Candidatus Sedimenticola sp. (ex Thyasira tokunagai)]
MNIGDTSVYTDFQGLGELKAMASRDADGSLEKVAQQFESLFIQQMLKTMRQASLGKGLMDSDQSLFYRDMYDQQLAIGLAESGGMGLADVIIRQLQSQRGVEKQSGAEMPTKQVTDYTRDAQHLKVVTKSAAVVAASEQTQAVRPEKDPAGWNIDDFVQQLLPLASEAATLIGIQPQALLAQAALETGWGKHMMHDPGGRSANNLFGIKADQRWDGERVKVDTLEYQEGVAVKKRDHFRAYGSYRDSFLDYVDFLRGSPRYSKALEVAGDSERYFSELQRAGYATDPKYANKISSIMAGDELRSALARFKAGAAEPL